MRKLPRNVIVLLIAICFSAVGLVNEKTVAQTKKTIKPTPSPKAKKSPPKTVKKTTAKPTPKTAKKNDAVKSVKQKVSSKTPVINKTPSNSKTTATTKSNVAKQVIVIATASRIRQQPQNNATILSVTKIGKVLPVTEKSAGWYRVQYTDGKSGWISDTIVKDFENSERDKVYTEIADRYFRKKQMDLATASEVLEFLRTAQALVSNDDLKAELNLKRLRILSAALKLIPSGKSEQSPYSNFTKANENEIVYSDPSDQWFVRSEILWDLRGRFTRLPIAEDIAWEAAQNPIPGECEGYVNCYLYSIRATSGEYLNFYPNGKYSRKALADITAFLEPLVADLKEQTVYTSPSDISDRAEFNRFLTELRAIISKVSDADKAKPLQLINRLGEGSK